MHLLLVLLLLLWILGGLAIGTSRVHIRLLYIALQYLCLFILIIAALRLLLNCFLFFARITCHFGLLMFLIHKILLLPVLFKLKYTVSYSHNVLNFIHNFYNNLVIRFVLVDLVESAFLTKMFILLYNKELYIVPTFALFMVRGNSLLLLLLFHINWFFLFFTLGLTGHFWIVCNWITGLMYHVIFSPFDILVHLSSIPALLPLRLLLLFSHYLKIEIII